ncbi:MAG: hypothetical protein LBF12_07235 [Christensenellaceae bacterium]|jgi:hypothetical protein|nr:hypothetical protein [Christensenellaceae bacterium]
MATEKPQKKETKLESVLWDAACKLISFKTPIYSFDFQRHIVDLRRNAA